MAFARHPGRSGGCSSGFSLVEVLVSSALLGLAAAGVLTLLLRSGLNNLEARRADGLVSAARSALAALDSAGSSERWWCPSVSAWRDDCGTEAPRFRGVVRTETVAVPARPGDQVAVEQVTLEVTSLAAGRAAGERTIRLVTYRGR